MLSVKENHITTTAMDIVALSLFICLGLGVSDMIVDYIVRMDIYYSMLIQYTLFIVGMLYIEVWALNRLYGIKN